MTEQELSISAVPPHSIEAEVCVLGAMMLDTSCIPMVQRMLKEGDFYRRAHQQIFKALVLNYIDGQPFDLVLFIDALQEQGTLEEIGGKEYLVEIVEGVPNAANAAHYAEIVRDKAGLRQIIIDVAEVQREAYSPTASYGRVRDLWQAAACAIPTGDDHGSSDLKDIGLAGKAVAEAIRHADKVHAGEASPGLSTGFGVIDRFTGAMQRGDLWTLAGPTSVGKTALALAIVANVAQQDGRALCVSAEMGKRALGNRLLQAHSKVEASRLRTGNLDEHEYEARTAAAEEIDKWKVAFEPKAATVGEIAIYVRQLVTAWGEPLDLIVVDYLQLMKPTSGDNRAQQVSGIALGLKNLATETGTPVLMLSQLNREGVNRDQLPSLYSLKESGDIENHSNVVLLLHRPSPGQYDTDGAPLLWLRIAKARDGRTTPWPNKDGSGGIRVRYRPKITRFEPSTL